MVASVPALWHASPIPLAAPAKLTYTKYVSLERSAAERHEFANGERLAMAGPTPTLREYLVVASDETLVEQHVLESGNRWVLGDHREGAVVLPSLGGELPLSEAYLKVALPPLPTPP